MWSGLDRRQAPRHAERRARRVVAAVHDVPSRSQRLGKLQVLENGLLWATEKDALCQQPLPGAGTTVSGSAIAPGTRDNAFRAA